MQWLFFKKHREFQFFFISFKFSSKIAAKQNQRHSVWKRSVRSKVPSSTRSLKKLIHHDTWSFLRKDHHPSILWLQGEDTYRWLFRSFRKYVRMAAARPFSVPRSVMKSIGQPLYCCTASK